MARTLLRRPGSGLPVAWLALAGALPLAAQDPAKDLRSKSPEVRLAAIDALARSDRPDADKLLVGVLDDKDWEMQERAAAALGQRKCKTAVKPLVELAIGGEVGRLRRIAATALLAIDPAEAAAALHKKARGATQVTAQEALAIVGRGVAGGPDGDKLKKLIRDQNAAVRESAAAAWLECGADRAGALTVLLAEPALVVRCRALDAVTAAPRPADLEPLASLLAGGALNDVVARRAVRAMHAVLAAKTDGGADAARATVERLSGTSHALARRARLLALLATGGGAPLDAKTAIGLLGRCFDSPDAGPRAAAAKALRDIGGDAALTTALERFASERDARARTQLLDSVVVLRGVDAPEEVIWLTDVLLKDVDRGVRERAAVLLGQPGIKDATSALGTALTDPHWIIAACAAVSLGKTGHDAALDPLVKLLKHAEWTRRGAAVVGLMHLNRKSVVEPLIGMLADASPIVARSAHEALKTIAWRGDLAADAKAWRAWWASNQEKHTFRDRREAFERQKQYGYDVPDKDIYSGLDVVVLTSSGDHIEQLLARLKIQHRETQSAHVIEAGLHPEAIFVCNCTGEIEAGDVDPLTWFVRTGGFFFGSCWALSKTIERIHPGVVRKLETPAGEVLDNVRALPCRSDSPLLNGVFGDGVVPIYHLEGAHLIEVLDPERTDVLIDSPDAAERHGGGNLAAWFPSGHGVILDSVNHFDLQGLEMAQGLKTERDRQAYAIDHMGLTYAKWRESQKADYWRASPRAAKSVPDLSAFRFITNFVRTKRMGGG